MKEENKTRWVKMPIAGKGMVIEISNTLERNIEKAIAVRENKIDEFIREIENSIEKLKKDIENDNMVWAGITADNIVSYARSIGIYINEIRLLKSLEEDDREK